MDACGRPDGGGTAARRRLEEPDELPVTGLEEELRVREVQLPPATRQARGVLDDEPGLHVGGSPAARVVLPPAVAQAERHVQVGFFDMKMPGGMDGLETIRRIREIDPMMYCVIVTAYQDRSLDEIGKVFGPEAVDQWEYLNKPFTANEIIQKARNATALWKRRRRHEELVKTAEESAQKFKKYFEKQMLNLALENKELRDKALRLETALNKVTGNKD